MTSSFISESSLYSKLKICNDRQHEGTSIQSREDIVDTCLSDILSKRKRHEIDQMKSKLKEKALLLDKANIDRKQKKKGKKRKQLVSNKLIRDLNLHSIPKEGQKYAYFVPLNHLWKQYISSVFKTGQNRLSLRADERLLKVDYHGAIFTVINSKCTTYIGLKGIVAKETKHMFMLITEYDELKCIPKKNNIFMFEHEGHRVKINGDAVLGRPGSRSNKKIKMMFFGDRLLDCL